ncbi:hypothetical protein C8R43DRAFT_464489 [Mycena crocata]|nr:hypothetical protein C8R43DRAFT_464489 [Mycena crocata]
MFALSYTPSYPSTYQRDAPSTRERYVSAISRVRQAEAEYVAYLAQQERVRWEARLLQQRRKEQARAALKRMQMLVVHAAVSSLLNAQSSGEPQRVPAPENAEQPTVNTDTSGAQLRKNRVRVVRPQETPVIAVRNALKSRLASEPSVEVHATIRRILSDISATPRPEDLPVPPAVAAIRSLERAFRTLATEFVFPPQLDFTPSSSGSYSAAKLPYTPRNAPVRHYEHALNGLLAQLDDIDSQGDTGVRGQRKLVVGLVEKALEELDRIVEGRWKLQDTRAEAPRERVGSGGASSEPPFATMTKKEPGTAATSSETASTEPSVEESSPTPSPQDLNPTLSESGSEPAASLQPLATVQEQQQPTPETVPSISETASIPPSSALQTPSPHEHRTETSLAAAVEFSAEELTPAAVALSPKSLSLITPLRDGETVLIELNDDSDSSWSEIE